jgi:hypothetical protein
MADISVIAKHRHLKSTQTFYNSILNSILKNIALNWHLEKVLRTKSEHNAISLEGR